MSVVVDVQGGVGQESGHDPGVGQRDDRVVGAGQDQGRLPQERECGQAGPAGAGEQLQQVPGQFGFGSQPAAVQLGGDRGGVVGVAVAAGGDHLAEHPGVGGDHQGSGGGADQDQSAAAAGMLEGDLLREPAAPGDAEDVELVVSQLVEQPDQEAGEQREVVGQAGCG